MKTRIFLSTLFLSVCMVGLSFAETTNPIETPTNKETEETIVEVAVGNDNFSTLVAAVKAASLVETLGSEGPFTVFAPTNAAFDKLPDGTIPTLLKPENNETLTSILTYHVIAGEFRAADVVKAIKESDYGKFKIKTVQGNKLVAYMKDGNVYLKDSKGNKSKVIMTDVDASNGVIHAIDTVVMPE